MLPDARAKLGCNASRAPDEDEKSAKSSSRSPLSRIVSKIDDDVEADPL